jgi:hypothetical protein
MQSYYQQAIHAEAIGGRIKRQMLVHSFTEAFPNELLIRILNSQSAVFGNSGSKSFALETVQNKK